MKIQNVQKTLTELQGQVAEIGEVLEVLDTSIIELRDKDKATDSNLVRLSSAISSLVDRIEEVRFNNDKREEAQTARDQSSVQSIKDLTDLTKLAFKKVEKDVTTLLNVDQRIIDSVTEIKKFQDDLVERAKRIVSTPAPEPCLPFDHAWVNKKLSGVYAYVTELETRLNKLENHTVGVDFDYGIQDPKPERTTYMGFDVRFKDNRLLLETSEEFDIFTVGEPYGEIVKVTNYPGGVLIDMKDWSQYALSGGPGLVQMYMYLLRKA
jgi:hypothetical protein